MRPSHVEVHIFVSCIELAVARHMFGMLNQNVHWTFWLKTGSDPAFCEKRLGSRPDLTTRTLFFRAMASSPRASAAVPPEGEMEVDFGDLEPVEPEDEDWQVVTAEQEAQNLADAQADFLAGRPSDTLAAPDELDEKTSADHWPPAPGCRGH